MLTLAPRWNWRSRVLFLLSILFWLLLATVAAIVTRAVVTRFLHQPESTSIGGVVVASLMIIGASVWLFGIIRTPRRTFHAHTEASYLIWREQQSGKTRGKKIQLSSIESFGPVGSANIGYYLLVSTRTKAHRLGYLLSIDDIGQLSQLIHQAIAAHNGSSTSSDKWHAAEN